MLCFPNCKINIGLYVTRKRADGYHDIETVFYLLPSDARNSRAVNHSAGAHDRALHLNDVLEIVPAEQTTLHMSGLAVAGSADDNLVMKAYKMLQYDYSGKVGTLDIYLHKAMPMGAGLGGGSADGAYMLRLMNDYYSLGLSEEQLITYALKLGSDCPVFIRNRPQYARGRGEVMEDIAIDLAKYSIQIVCPHMHVYTAAAFGMITPKAATYDLRQLPALPIEEWQNHIHNDFEEPVFSRHPALRDIKNNLYDQGALYASMSGSGSALYGIFPKSQQAQIDRDGVSVLYIP